MSTLAFLSCPELWVYGHGQNHPLKPERLQRTYELLQEFGALSAYGVQVVEPRIATDEELVLFHTLDYIDAVRQLSARQREVELGVQPGRYHFGPGDNPVFEGMFESESLKVGSALLAAEMLLNSECRVAFSFAGGLHHAGPDFASGFCVFNDAVIVILWLLQQGQRIAYIDIDVHHGDGVQAAFYDDKRVLTISLHQDGHSLFPGTGFIEEIGKGDGSGFNVNLPLPPNTDDEIYLWAFHEIVPPLVKRFQPDILVSQFGVDTHYLDPLANLALTTRGQATLFQALLEMAPRWLALGGGGYNLGVVPRAWTLAFACMAELDLPDELPAGYRKKYGGRWLHDRETPQIGPLVRRVTHDRVQSTVTQLKHLHHID